MGCKCVQPNGGTHGGLNNYSCLDGVEGSCGEHHLCIATDDFDKPADNWDHVCKEINMEDLKNARKSAVEVAKQAGEASADLAKATLASDPSEDQVNTCIIQAKENAKTAAR